MFTAYLVVTVLTVAANAYAVALDFGRTKSAVSNVTKVGGSPSWLIPLGLLKAAGALGLLVGIAVPPVGVAAAVGLMLFFAGAMGAHLRVRWYETIAFPGTFFLLATGSLVLRIASS